MLLEIIINIPVVNSFVLFIPWIINRGTVNDQQRLMEWRTSSYDLFWVFNTQILANCQKLIVSSNPIMRDVLLHAIVNQIRYPNPITFYFTGLITYLIGSIPDEGLQEQILE